MDKEHEALVILTRLAEHLRKQYLPLPVNGQKVLPTWMAKAADNIEQYLNNLDVKSLDAAFGLEPGHDLPSKPGPKPDIKKELPIVTEYLRILCKENPYLADDGREIDCQIPDEEEAPHGTQARLARMFGESESQISKIISRWRNDKSLMLQASLEIIKKDLFE